MSGGVALGEVVFCGAEEGAGPFAEKIWVGVEVEVEESAGEGGLADVNTHAAVMSKKAITTSEGESGWVREVYFRTVSGCSGITGFLYHQAMVI